MMATETTIGISSPSLFYPSVLLYILDSGFWRMGKLPPGREGYA